LTAFAFWTAVRNRELFSGCGPPSFTAMAISFPNRVNWTAIFAQRLNFRSFLNSKALPIFSVVFLLLSFLFKVCNHVLFDLGQVKFRLPVQVCPGICIVYTVRPGVCNC